MTLIDENNSIRYSRFKCLETNKIYEIRTSKCNGYKALDTTDTLLREDGVRRNFTRYELMIRFKKIEKA